MNAALLLVGLLIPGGGSLLRGRVGEALLALWTVSLLLALSAVALVAANRADTAPAASLLQALRALRWPMQVPPTVPVTGLLALAVHGVCAWGAARDGPDRR